VGDFSPWDEGADNGAGVWPFGSDSDADDYDSFDDDHAPITMLHDEIAQVFGPPGTGKGKAACLQEAIDTLAALDPSRPDDTFGLFQVVTSKAMPPNKTFVLPDKYSDLLRTFRAQYPSLEAFEREFMNYQPRAQVRVTDATFRTDTTRSKPTMENLAAFSRKIESMLSQFRDMAARIERFGGEPEIGAVIKFEHTFAARSAFNPGGTYTYVAFRADNGDWYTTGRPKHGPISWAELLEFIGDGRAWIMWPEREVPVPNPGAITIESADSETVGRVATELAALPEAEREAVLAEALKLARGESKED
jgi:hypothetical protein